MRRSRSGERGAWSVERVETGDGWKLKELGGSNEGHQKE